MNVRQCRWVTLFNTVLTHCFFFAVAHPNGLSKQSCDYRHHAVLFGLHLIVVIEEDCTFNRPVTDTFEYFASPVLSGFCDATTDDDDDTLHYNELINFWVESIFAQLH